MKNLWQKPNSKNLYDDEVLAIGFQKELIVGYLVEDDDSSGISLVVDPPPGARGV